MTSQPNSPERADGARQPGAADEPQTVIIRERKKQRRRRKSSKRRRVPVAVKVIVGIVAALAIVALSAFAFVTCNVSRGDAQLHTPDIDETGRTITYKGHTYRYNENVVAVLVAGKDDESSYAIAGRNCTDANILVTLDTETKDLNVIAIPRDSMVDVDLFKDGEYTRTGKHQLAVAYGVDVDSEEAAAANTLKSVSKLFYSLPIKRYFVLETDAVSRLSSAVGGVKVEALETIPGAGYVKGETVLLEGDAAKRYVQYRNADAPKSAQARQDRQMQFVRAFLDKLRRSDLGTIVGLYNTVRDTTFTNLDVSDITYLASVFLDGRAAQSKYLSLTGTTKLEADDDGVEREHIYLSEKSVMKATLKAFYTRID